MKNAKEALETLLASVSDGKPLVADLVIQEGGTAKTYTAKHGFPVEPAEDPKKKGK